MKHEIDMVPILAVCLAMSSSDPRTLISLSTYAITVTATLRPSCHARDAICAAPRSETTSPGPGVANHDVHTVSWATMSRPCGRASDSTGNQSAGWTPCCRQIRACSSPSCRSSRKGDAVAFGFLLARGDLDVEFAHDAHGNRRRAAARCCWDDPAPSVVRSGPPSIIASRVLESSMLIPALWTQSPMGTEDNSH